MNICALRDEIIKVLEDTWRCEFTEIRRNFWQSNSKDNEMCGVNEEYLKNQSKTGTVDDLVIFKKIIILYNTNNNSKF